MGVEFARIKDKVLAGFFLVVQGFSPGLIFRRASPEGLDYRSLFIRNARSRPATGGQAYRGIPRICNISHIFRVFGRSLTIIADIGKKRTLFWGEFYNRSELRYNIFLVCFSDGKQMDDERLSLKDIILSLLYAPTGRGKTAEPVSGRTRLVKMVFLFWKELMKYFKNSVALSDKDFEEIFVGWHYGPFSKDVYAAIDFFKDIGFLKAIVDDEFSGNVEWEEYANWQAHFSLPSYEDETERAIPEVFELTEQGISFVESELWSRLSSEQKRILTEFKTRFNGAPLMALVRYVYDSYPEYTKKSKIRRVSS